MSPTNESVHKGVDRYGRVPPWLRLLDEWNKAENGTRNHGHAESRSGIAVVEIRIVHKWRGRASNSGRDVCETGYGTRGAGMEDVYIPVDLKQARTRLASGREALSPPGSPAPHRR